MARRRGNMQQQVLDVLRKEGQPQSAYVLLGRLRQTNPQLAPTSIYRALTALIEKGEVRRIESLKAFVASRLGGKSDASIVTICDDCGVVEESIAPGLIDDITAELAGSGFALRRHVVELHGHCGACGVNGAEK